MSTKEQDFKERFIAILENVREVAFRDQEAMWSLGTLAVQVLDTSQERTWRNFKARVTQEVFSNLLTEFEQQARILVREGKTKHAYAVQLLATSLVASTQKDKHVRDGVKLLDEVVDMAVTRYRAASNTTPVLNRPIN